MDKDKAALKDPVVVLYDLTTIAVIPLSNNNQGPNSHHASHPHGGFHAHMGATYS